MVFLVTSPEEIWVHPSPSKQLHEEGKNENQKKETILDFCDLHELLVSKKKSLYHGNDDENTKKIHLHSFERTPFHKKYTK